MTLSNTVYFICTRPLTKYFSESISVAFKEKTSKFCRFVARYTLGYINYIVILLQHLNMHTKKYGVQRKFLEIFLLFKWVEKQCFLLQKRSSLPKQPSTNLVLSENYRFHLLHNSKDVSCCIFKMPSQLSFHVVIECQ